MEKEKNSWIDLVINSRLVDASEIKAVAEISNSKFPSTKDLKRIMYVSGLFFAHHNFNAIAYNQYSDEVLEQAGIKEFKNIIYFANKKENGDLKNQIVINPKVEIVNDGQSYFSLECCGSIDNGRTLMLIERAKNISLQGFFWNTTTYRLAPEYKNIMLSDWPSSMAQHEVDHLKGMTALSSPGKIRDILNPDESVLNRFNVETAVWKDSLKALVGGGVRFLKYENNRIQIIE